MSVLTKYSSFNGTSVTLALAGGDETILKIDNAGMHLGMMEL